MKQFAILLLSSLMILSISCQKEDDSDDDIINNQNQSSSFVNKNDETRTVVIEEFTGVRCGYCPQGAAIVADLMANNPDKVIGIGIHGGSYSTPYSGDPDLSTTWANAIISFSGLTGYPQAMVGRYDHDNNGQLAMSRSLWESVTNTLLNENASVNIGIKSEYDSSTKKAEIKVEYYYTSDAADASNLINIAITENGIITQQAGATGDYEHTHVLRDFITGQWGESISETSKGSTEILTYTYTVPDNFDADKCDVIAYITNSDKTVIINGEMTTLVNGSAD